jgi:transketolase
MAAIKPARRPEKEDLIGKNPKLVPMSCQRVMGASSRGEMHWIGPEQAVKLSQEDQKAYGLAHKIMCHLAIQAPTKHKSGHPGGPLSAFTFCYELLKRRDPSVDQPLRMSAGHLSVLAYGLQWLFGREGNDRRLQTPQAIIEAFRTADGLPGHAEAGVGDIPFGAGPLGKGVSNGLGAAFGLKYLKKPGVVDVLMADGDCQEGQTMEAFRLASHLHIDNLVVHGDFNDIQLSGMPSRIIASDFASIAAAAGWNVIEVQNGNDPGQVNAALELADCLRCLAEEPRASEANRGASRSTAPRGGATLRQAQCDTRPTFICYYTTMGHGVKLMERGSNTGSKNYHGSPLTKEEAEKALEELPPLEEVTKAYKPYREAEKKRYMNRPRIETDLELNWKLPKGYTRTVTVEKGSMRQDFGAVHIKALMNIDPRIVVLHADLAGSGGFDVCAKALRDAQPQFATNWSWAPQGDVMPRVINVGVAEANMVMMAAGMRQVGLLPVTYTFAAFGCNEARANLRLIDINCGHTRCAVLYDFTHAGVNVGEDGETHQEQNYLNLPFHNTEVWCPADSNQAGAMAEAALEKIAEGHMSVAVMMPRLGSPQVLRKDGKPFYGSSYKFEGKADVLRGSDSDSGSGRTPTPTRDRATILSYGIALHKCMEAVDVLEKKSARVRLINVSCIRPLDTKTIERAIKDTGRVVVVEDHNIEGGLASRVADLIVDRGLQCTLKRIGLTCHFPSGKGDELLTMAGISVSNIVKTVKELLKSLSP